jgi:hypothetical protein
VSKSGSRRPPARVRLAEQRALEAKRKRQRRWFAGIGGAVVAVGAAVVITIAVMSGGGSSGPVGGGSTPQLKLTALSTLGTLKSAPSAGPTGPEGVPVPPGAPALASASGSVTGQTTDGIGCQTSEQTLFHIHTHLTIFVNGKQRQVPAAIGIPGAVAQQTSAGPFIDSGTCFYWLHTHAADGIIHIESPVRRAYTLGQFFDEWRQPLGPGQAGPARGRVTALYNGRVYRGNPRGIPLTAHAQIQLEVGTPLIAPVSITWPGGL